MTEFSFLGSWQDSWDILDSIFEGGEFTAIPDLKYASPEPLHINRLDDNVKSMLRDRRHLFIWGKSFSLFPPSFQRIEGEAQAGRNSMWYSIYLPEGGPGLELTLPAYYEESGVLNLGPGTVACPRLWFNRETKMWLRPTAELKAGFKEVRSRIKRHLVHCKERPDIWIGHDAARVLDEKNARIIGFERPSVAR